MAPSGKQVFKYVSSEMPNIIEASIKQARLLGHSQVTPQHVVDRLIYNTSSMICGSGDCHRCNALKSCFSTAVIGLPVSFPAEPSLSDELVVSIRSAINSFRGRRCFHLEDVKKLFVLLLDDPKVRNALQEAGFSTSVIKDNVENCGTVC